jgi:hypothetical protein
MACSYLMKNTAEHSRTKVSAQHHFEIGLPSAFRTHINVGSTHVTASTAPLQYTKIDYQTSRALLRFKLFLDPLAVRRGTKTTTATRSRKQTRSITKPNEGSSFSTGRSPSLTGQNEAAPDPLACPFSPRPSAKVDSSVASREGATTDERLSMGGVKADERLSVELSLSAGSGAGTIFNIL